MLRIASIARTVVFASFQDLINLITVKKKTWKEKICAREVMAIV